MSSRESREPSSLSSAPEVAARGPSTRSRGGAQRQCAPDRQQGRSSRNHPGSRGPQGRLEVGRHTRERGAPELQAVKNVTAADDRVPTHARGVEDADHEEQAALDGAVRIIVPAWLYRGATDGSALPSLSEATGETLAPL